VSTSPFSHLSDFFFIVALILLIFCRRAERWRYFDLVKSILASRQRLVDAVVNGEKPKVSTQLPKKPRNSHSHQIKSRYFQELSLIREEVGESSQSSEDENYPGI
jgi:hypothetical protein